MPITRRCMLVGAGLATAARPRASAAATATKPPVEALALGALFPFSGPLSLLGDESFRGLDLATDERNAAGGLFGRPLRLVRADATDSAQATAEIKRLLGEAHVAAVFGTLSSPVSLAASAATELAGVPYFELDALADALTERGLRLLFRTGATGGACGAMAADTVADLLIPRWQIDPQALRVTILHQDDIAGSAIANAALQRCQLRGLRQAELIAYGASLLDFGPILQRLRGAGVDVVLHAGLINDVLVFHRAMQQAGWRPRMVVGIGGGYALTDTAQALGAAFEGVMCVGVTPYRISDVAAPGVAAVAAAYQRKYGAPPRSGHSLVCFAGARVFFDAIERAGTLEPEKLRAAVLATDIPAGATVGGWGVRFDERGQNLRAVPYLAQWQNGALLTVAPTPAAVGQAATTLG